jgi:hypothetical protein
MNPRERALAILLVVVIVLGAGGFFGYQFIFVPWTTKTKQLATLKKDYEAKVQRQEEIKQKQGDLQRWRMLSLPADRDVAAREYEKYLTELLTHHNITNGRSIEPPKQDDANKTAPTTSDKQPIYNRLAFKVHAYTTMANLVGMLRDFYNTGLMQQIKHLTIQRQLTPSTQVRPDELDVNMTVETLIVTGADKRSYLMPNFDRGLMKADLTSSLFKNGAPLVLWAAASPGLSPSGLLADPPRNYEAVARKNIFLGRPATTDGDGTPEWMVPRFVHLTDITRGTLRMDAMLYDVLKNRKMKLRESSFNNTFMMVRDGKSLTSAVDGAVVKIEDREVIYRAEFHLSDDPSRSPGFSRPAKAEREKLVADGAIKSDDAEAVLRADREFWDRLVRARVVSKSYSVPDGYVVRLERAQEGPGGEDDFSTAADVLGCRVLHQDSTSVYVRPDERYYSIHIGESIEDSLKRKLPNEKVKALKQEVAAN